MMKEMEEKASGYTKLLYCGNLEYLQEKASRKWEWSGKRYLVLHGPWYTDDGRTLDPEERVKQRHIAYEVFGGCCNTGMSCKEITNTYSPMCKSCNVYTCKGFVFPPFIFTPHN